MIDTALEGIRDDYAKIQVYIRWIDVVFTVPRSIAHWSELDLSRARSDVWDEFTPCSTGERETETDRRGVGL